VRQNTSNFMDTKRCGWVNTDPIYIQYHDEEWGMPVTDDQRWFEFIILDGFQAGLSWYTIIKKRDNFRAAFDNFDPTIVAQYDEAKQESLMADAGIIRNRLKIKAAVGNAIAFLQIQEEFVTFNDYIWQFTDNQTIVNTWQSLKEVPARTDISDKMSKDLQKRGFKFVGSTICYAFMQAAGMVNDHLVDCCRYEDCCNGMKK
jgi:DNA-3-methyladenine glycosylase I